MHTHVRHGQDDLMKVRVRISSGEGGCNLHDMVVCARGLVRDVQNQVEFLCTTISRVYRSFSEKEKISSLPPFSGGKHFVKPEARGQWPNKQL